LEILVPNIDSLCSNIDSLIWKIRKLSRGEEIILNMENISFIRPEMIMTLVVFCDKIYENTNVPVKLIKIKPEVSSYLNYIRFYELPFILSMDNRTRSFGKTFGNIMYSFPTYKLIRLETIKDIYNYNEITENTNRILEKWFPNRITDKFCSSISSLIRDIAGNSLEHSSLEGNSKCYFMLQEYKQKNGNPKVVMVLGDAGIGIKNHLHRRHDWIYNDIMAIKKALIDGVSGRIDGSGGLGFMQIKDILNRYNGTITIRSGYASVKYTPSTDSHEETKHNRYFWGTQTSIIV
jgi:hypothetical protein